MSPRYLLAAERIRKEREDIERAAEKALLALQHAKEDPSNETFYFDSLALNLHAFYSGIERIFELVAREMDESLPNSGRWHQQLLEQMSLRVAGVRPPLISQQTCEQLADYLGFRHVVRNLYTFNLRPDRLAKLAETLEATVTSFRRDSDQFLEYLEEISRSTET